MTLFDTPKKEPVSDLSALKNSLSELTSQGFFTAYRTNVWSIFSTFLSAIELSGKTSLSLILKPPSRPSISQYSARRKGILTDYLEMHYKEFKITICPSDPAHIKFEGTVSEHDYQLMINALEHVRMAVAHLIFDELGALSGVNLCANDLSPVLIEAFALHKINPKHIKALLGKQHNISITKSKLKFNDSENTVEIQLPKTQDVNTAWKNMAHRIKDSSFMQDILAYKTLHGKSYGLGLPFIYEPCIVTTKGNPNRTMENLILSLQYLYFYSSAVRDRIKKFTLSPADSGLFDALVIKFIITAKNKEQAKMLTAFSQLNRNKKEYYKISEDEQKIMLELLEPKKHVQGFENIYNSIKYAQDLAELTPEAFEKFKERL